MTSEIEKIKFGQLNLGTVFTYGGIDWIKLRNNVCITKDCIGTTKYDDAINMWEICHIKLEVIPAFQDSLQLTQKYDDVTAYKYFKEIVPNLDAFDGTTSYARNSTIFTLPSIEIIASNKDLIALHDSEFGSHIVWWTMTPVSYTNMYDNRRVVCFHNNLTYSFEEVTNESIYFRPICRLKDNAEVLFKHSMFK